MDPQDLYPPNLVGPVDQHLAVESARAQQCRVKDFRPVGGGQQHQPRSGIEAVEFRQELVQRLLFLVMATSSSWTSSPSWRNSAVT